MRTLLILLITFSFLHAGWCVWHSSQKRIYPKEAETFFLLVRPAIIAKHKGWYRFLSGPFATKQEAMEAKERASKLFPDGFLYRCTKLRAREVRMVLR